MIYTVIYRVQDTQGRGPYKPGFTDKWRDPDGHPWPVPWDASEMGPSVIEDIRSYHTKGYNYGFGFESLGQLLCWFSPAELGRLAATGHRPVSMEVDIVHCKTQNQLLFFRKMPLRSMVTIIEA